MTINKDRLMLLVFSPLLFGALIAGAAGEAARQFPRYFLESWRHFGKDTQP